MASLTDTLRASGMADNTIRANADKVLLQAENHDFTGFVTQLCAEFMDQNKEVSIRRAALIHLRGIIYGRSESLRASCADRWMNCPLDLRVNVKNALVNTMKDQQAVIRRDAAQCVASIGIIELNRNQWPELIQYLASSVADANISTDVKEVCFICLGEVLSYTDSQLIRSLANDVLGAIAAGMTSDNNNVLIASTDALRASLQFCEANMRNEQERGHIMGFIARVMQVPNIEVQVAGWKCLVEVADRYYSLMGPYLAHIFPISLGVMSLQPNDENEALIKIAFEFWIALFDQEAELQEELEEAKMQGAVGDELPQGSLGYATLAVQGKILDPIFLNLQRQPDHYDDNDFTISNAAGLTLRGISMAVGDLILETVIQFVGANLGSDNWRTREAACTAFGCVVEGSSSDALENYKAALDPLLKCMNDTEMYVRAAAGWAVAQYVDKVDLANDQLIIVYQQLVRSLKDKPMCVRHVLSALYHITFRIDPNTQHNALSDYMQPIITGALEVADSKTVDSQLLVSAYEVIGAVAKAGAEDTIPLITKLLPVVGTRLTAMLEYQAPEGAAQERQATIIGLLCATLDSIIIRIETSPSAKEEVGAFVTGILELLMRIFARFQSVDVAVSEEAMLAISTTVRAFGARVIEQVKMMIPAATEVLTKFTQHPTYCQSAAGFISLSLTDCSEAYDEPSLDRIVSAFCGILGDQYTDTQLKARVISTSGDIALRFGTRFERYMKMLSDVAAAATRVAVTSKDMDEELIEAIKNLQISLLEYFSAVLSTVGESALPRMVEYYRDLIIFIRALGTDPEITYEGFKAGLDLLGDICVKARHVGGNSRDLIKRGELEKFISVANRRKPRNNDDYAQALRRATRCLEAINRI